MPSMKRISIILLFLILCFGILQAQNNQNSNKVVVLYDYLYVFSDDLGLFDAVPVNIIINLNKNKMYGYNDWRIPTVEELQLICANKDKLPFHTNDFYMSNDWGTTVFLASNPLNVNENCKTFSANSGHIILVRSNNN